MKNKSRLVDNRPDYQPVNISIREDRELSELAAIKATVYGRVQGVFFRVSTRRRAAELGLKGDVCNLRDISGVEVHAEGEKEQLEKLVEFLKTGPPGARVEKIEVYWSDYTGDYTDFIIKY